MKDSELAGALYADLVDRAYRAALGVEEHEKRLQGAEDPTLKELELRRLHRCEGELMGLNAAARSAEAIMKAYKETSK